MGELGRAARIGVDPGDEPPVSLAYLLQGGAFGDAFSGTTVLLILLGTLVIFTFDPCPTGTAADLLPSFSAAR